MPELRGEGGGQMSMYHFTDRNAVEHDLNTMPATGDFERIEVDGVWFKPILSYSGPTPKVDRHALLALAGELEKEADDNWLGDMRDVGKGMAQQDAARRIRDALGVDDVQDHS